MNSKGRAKRRRSGGCVGAAVLLSVLLLMTAGSLMWMFGGDAITELFGGAKDVMVWLDDEQQSITVTVPTDEDDGAVRVIALDAGHGGRDSGAVNRGLGLYEDELNLAIARELRTQLERTGYFRVIMIREELAENEKLELSQRIEYAAEQGADLYLSLHNNTSEARYSGAEIYHSGSGSEQARSAKALGYEIMRQFGELGMRRRGVFVRLSQSAQKSDPTVSASDTKPTGFDSDYYAVVRGGEQLGIPALLIEHGFLNANDKRFISGTMAAKRLAQAETRAILCWCGMASAEKQGGSGDCNADGKVDKKDTALALDALMCREDAPTDEQYNGADIDSSGLIEAWDVARMMLCARSDASSADEVPCSDAQAAQVEMEADRGDFRSGKTVNVTVTVGGERAVLAASGTVDYNTKYFDLTKVTDAPRGLEWEEDSMYGLARWVYTAPEGKEGEELTFTLRLRMKGNADSLEALSLNANCYGLGCADGSGGIAAYSHTTASVRLAA